MTLSDLLETVEERRKTLVVYSTEAESDPTDHLETRNASVEHRRLPGPGSAGFVVVREGDEFVGSIGLSEFRTLLEPPVFRPSEDASIESGYRALFELLDNTLFTSLERRQLLAAAREIENRAGRVGNGALRVGFQRLSAMRPQLPVYTRLGEDTNLQIHVYGDADWEPPDVRNVTVHVEGADEIGRFWFLAFDGGSDERQRCALVAEERDEGEYYGFWTYDPDLVEELSNYLERRYE